MPEALIQFRAESTGDIPSSPIMMMEMYKYIVIRRIPFWGDEE
jgi:hypothetical protein